uniref:hypothetical protein n=1 Tax=Pedobacter schmidteae TaxID=2201271 RepID=UPI000EB06582|nr:hypothetical protein [Pedobacter schmidteae]
MFNNQQALEKLMKLLRSVRPKFDLPMRLEYFFKEHMDEYDPVPNEDLVVRGRIPLFAYYIISGYVYVTYKNKEGQLRVKYFYAADSIVAFICFLDRLPSHYHIYAGHHTKLAVISRASVGLLFEEWEHMRSFAYTVLIEDDRFRGEIYDDLMELDPVPRVVEFYRLNPCLLPAVEARLDKWIARFLKLKLRYLVKIRQGLGQ